MEDWERKRIDERLTRLETEFRELKLKLTLDEDKRKFRRGLIPMVVAMVFAIALPTFVVVSRLAAGG